MPPATDRRARCAVAVMAKASTPGRVKTRLTPPLTPDQAAKLNSAFLADTIDNLALAGRRAAIDPFIAFGPIGAGPLFQHRFDESVGLMEVSFPNFGDCLLTTVSLLLERGYGSVCVLNSDGPDLPTELLVQAATNLGRPGDRVVLGPSLDGGYYLLGLKARHARLFEEITWSTELVFKETLERASELGIEVTTLAPWYDVDDADTLRLFVDRLGDDRGGEALAPFRASHSRRALAGSAVLDILRVAGRDVPSIVTALQTAEAP